MFQRAFFDFLFTTHFFCKSIHFLEYFLQKMVITTRVTKMFGVEHPIVMGGMTGVGTPELAAAVSNAGGLGKTRYEKFLIFVSLIVLCCNRLGIFAAHNAGSPEVLKQWIAKMRTLTSKPFGINLTILPHMGTPIPYDEFADVIIKSGVKIVETAGSNPKKWISLFKKHGVLTIHKCVAIRHALKAQKLGVDCVSLDGFEW